MLYMLPDQLICFVNYPNMQGQECIDPIAYTIDLVVLYPDFSSILDAKELLS